MSNQLSKKMEKDFDFNRIGKRMPYKTPDNFFNELETGIWEKVRDTSPEPARRKNIRLRLLLGAAAVAAGISLLLVFLPFIRERHTDFSEVEQAFANLSEEDQAYMLDVYREDVFINE